MSNLNAAPDSAVFSYNRTMPSNKRNTKKITGVPAVLTYLSQHPKPIGLINKSTLHYMQRLGLIWVYETKGGIKKAALSHTGLAAYLKMRGKG